MFKKHILASLVVSFSAGTFKKFVNYLEVMIQCCNIFVEIIKNPSAGAFDKHITNPKRS